MKETNYKLAEPYVSRMTDGEMMKKLAETLEDMKDIIDRCEASGRSHDICNEYWLINNTLISYREHVKHKEGGLDG